MTPKILDYLDGEIVITPEAFIIKELNDIIKKYGDKEACPYLSYVHLMTWPESPYITLPEDEISDAITFDVIQACGDFDLDEPLIQPAIERMYSLWDTESKRYYKALKIGMRKTSQIIESEEVISGRDGNLSEFNRMIREAGSTLKSFKDVEKIIDDEIKTKMRGKSTLGDY